MKDQEFSRRQFIKTSAVATAGLSLGLAGLSPNQLVASQFTKTSTPGSLASASPICVFSKHLEFLSVPNMIQEAKSLGFDGIDLTVRKGGHVEPANAAAELPKIVAAIRKGGLEIPMMVTNIVDAKDPLTESILKTAGKLGIKYYRTGYLNYDMNLGVAKSLENHKKQLAALADLNKKCNIQGAYQNHSGVRVGASVWDLWVLMKDLDPRWMGVQYDIKHATLEGGLSWVHGLNLLKDHISCFDIKDFHWEKRDGKWRQKQVPLGEGMVDYKQFFNLVKQYNITGPMSMHFEYPLGGAQEGHKQLTIPKEEVLAAMKRDLQVLKDLRKEANIG